ncbi:hypothetical protein BCON_0116g00350 [Botryotinia convoluta]|uniref:Uncharacterized protein n=1 Tax=Botryotinia convoluta TaxID=54673 RepID=A0A4Z1HXU4_9HELO|nr:hypothetical protein BCON_0116g00350 [Botryotinia convoluta]
MSDSREDHHIISISNHRLLINLSHTHPSFGFFILHLPEAWELYRGTADVWGGIVDAHRHVLVEFSLFC